MKTMLAASLTLALASASLAAQEPVTGTFPAPERSPASCDQFQWNAEMRREHPRIVDGCQEVVMTPNGQIWARLAANFVMVHSDGSIVFEVVDSRDRMIEQIALTPRPGQMATIDGKQTPFERLRTSDRINLYAPENAYGFGIEPGVPPDQLVTVNAIGLEPASAPAEAVVDSGDEYIAMNDAEPARMLPATASLFPALIAAGLATLLAAAFVALRRRT
jgi:hypothetical protein